MSDTNVNNANRPSREGERNPMYGRKHSQESKNKMSKAAIKRNQEYQRYKQAMDSQHITMDELLSNKPLNELINQVIKEQIDKLLWNETKRISR